MTKVYDTATDLITFSRLQSQNTTSGSSYLGSDGLLKFAAEDEPRIEYGSDGSLKGLLIEEQRTNLVPYSEDFSNAAWLKVGTVAIDSTLVTGPDGTLSGRKVLNLNAASGDRLTGTVSVTNSTITGSFWVKGDGANIGKDVLMSVKRSGGTFAGSANVTHTLTSEWVRLDATFTQLPDNTGAIVVLGSPSTNSASEVLIYGAQLEAGSFATSYIPTSGSQQTRSADVASIPVSAFGYNQDAGTVVVEFDMLSDNAGSNTLTQAAFGFHDGTSNNRLELFSASAGVLTLRDRIAPVNHDAISSGNSLEQPTKSAASYASGEASKLVVNGGSASVAATATTPPAYSTLLLGDTQNVDAELNGHIKSIQYYPRRLTDAQLQELTA